MSDKKVLQLNVFMSKSESITNTYDYRQRFPEHVSNESAKNFDKQFDYLNGNFL